MSGLHLPKVGTIEICPSILSADFAKLADELAEIEAAGIKIVHLDVMDGHFVPNITFGPPVVAKLRKCSKLVFDAHLMITDPDTYAERFADAGANHITFHIETTKKPEKLIEKIRGFGCSAGVCINPETPVDAIAHIAGICDMVLVMTVHPGFGGQKFIAAAAEKIAPVRKLIGKKIRLEVDGGIDSTTAARVVADGADTLVAGNAVFAKSDRAAAIAAIRDSIR